MITYINGIFFKYNEKKNTMLHLQQKLHQKQTITWQKSEREREKKENISLVVVTVHISTLQVKTKTSLLFEAFFPLSFSPSSWFEVNSITVKDFKRQHSYPRVWYLPWLYLIESHTQTLFFFFGSAKAHGNSNFPQIYASKQSPSTKKGGFTL